MSQLKNNAVGLLGAATFGVVMMSPAMTLYACFGPSFISAQFAAPLGFLIAFFATVPTALSYAACSREHPHSGSAADWMSRLFPAQPAAAAGWMVFFYYFLNFITQPVAFGVFLNELFSMLGLPSGYLVFAAGAVLCCAIPAASIYKGITRSSKAAFSFLTFETAVVIGLCLTVAWLAPRLNHAEFSLIGLTPHYAFSTATVGSAGLFQAIIFGLFSFCGYDVISTLAEETKAPRKLIPQATFIALAMFAVLMIAGIWVLTYAIDPSRAKAIADAGGMPIREVAQMYLGKAALLVPITAMTAALGLTIASSVGSTRILFSLGRKGHAPEVFSRVHPSYQTPWAATHLVMMAGLVLSLVTGAMLGPYNTYVWWSTASTMFAMITYIFVNLSNVMLLGGGRVSWWRTFAFRSFFLHTFVPIAGIVINGYLLFRCFFVETWAQGFLMGKSIIIFDVACVVFGIFFAFRFVDVSSSTAESLEQPLLQPVRSQNQSN